MTSTSNLTIPDRTEAQARAERAAKLKPRGIAPTPADIGRKVVYRTAPNFEAEEGVITSLGRIGNVFVRYGTGSTSASTDCGDLDWAVRSPRDANV